MQAQPDVGLHLTEGTLLILAALLLLTALRMLRQALLPLREVLRALAATGAMTVFIVLAFVLGVGSLILSR
jgi:hypothetical protein